MISAVILTRNEEKNIERCLNSLLWCDEILVIDDNSIDLTGELAKNAGAKVIKHSLNNDFSEQRNFALTKVKGDWILFIDADERVSSELKEEIKDKLNKESGINGYFLKRKDFFMGKWLKHGETENIKILRLAKKDMGKWERSVDEVWKIKGKTKVLDHSLLHYPHPSVKQFLESINTRSSLNANEFHKNDRKPTVFEWLKPLAKFIFNYFIKFGFLDGVQGFIFAVLMSLHSFLVRGKLFLLWNKGNGK